MSLKILELHLDGFDIIYNAAISFNQFSKANYVFVTLIQGFCDNRNEYRK